MAIPSSAEPLLLQGEAGHIEVLVDKPEGEPRGIAVVAHPHPVQGGTATHKVPVQLAKVLVSKGYVAARPNFRGVGASEGKHDHGDGETRDMLTVLEALRQQYPGLPFVLGGFSFGAYVMALAAAQLTEQGTPCPHLILTGMPWGKVHAHADYQTPPVAASALVVHGEQDERVALSAIFEWARPQELPVVVVPGANHFFTGKLGALTRIVEGYLERVERERGEAS
ncbi:alpha/beta hydrolase [Paracidovorax citrulli]